MDTIYIKSPLNYVGGKYKILDQIIPKFPKYIHTFVDLFGGGFGFGDDCCWIIIVLILICCCCGGGRGGCC